VLCSNTIKVRLVGALAATFLFRGEVRSKNAKEDGSQKTEVGGTMEMAVLKQGDSGTV